MNSQPLFVAPSSAWTGQQTIEAFAKERGRKVAQRHEDGSYSFVDGVKRYRITNFSFGNGQWVFGVTEDDGRPV